MSDLSPELNLALAVDDDDTADYLVTTQGLRGNLNVLDGLFNQTTGHAHNGAHQGGALQFQNLLVGQDLTVNGATDLKGAAILRQTLHVVGISTMDALVTAQSLDVTTTSHLRGLVTLDAGLTLTGTLTITGPLTATGIVTGRYLYTSDGSVGAVYAPDGALYLRPKAGSAVVLDQGGLTGSTFLTAGTYISAGATLSAVAGDISANRGNNTGYLLLGNASHYVGFDGTSYQMAASNLYTNGSLVANEINVAALSNKTLVDPKVTAQVTLGGGSYTFPSVTGNAGMWRYVKAWGSNLTILLTNGTFILGNVQYTSGQYILAAGDSVSCYCEGANWWVL